MANQKCVSITVRKGFSKDNGKNIWVYDKHENREFATQVKSVGNITNFYSADVEQYLADIIEGPANTVIERIRNQEQISDSEKEILSEYMAVMFKRVPRGLERLNEMAPSICTDLHNKISKDLLQIAKEEPDKVHVVNNRLAEIEKILEKYAKNPPKEIWLENIPPGRSPQMVAALVGMKWRFLVIENSMNFLTSDNPFFHFTSIGVGNPESEACFPISNKILLWATWRNDLPLGYITATKQGIKEMNRRAASNATRFIFNIEFESWILPFIKKKQWKLHLFK
ncbi:DUF4238 domain-containing protein [uncultured Desulfosarcina sp.]|uniref:DUF4238 domain-containing protein n=1 Tax=uncultured Desulfosarcina sp. TaxID=218289 RepID=UPI0029C65415|nr:DUF4238 domain-containing protein [uncultured Desulfosarcina sp.]